MPSDFPGTFEEFVATLPASAQTIADFDKQMLYETAQENAAIALALATKRREMKRILTRLQRDLEAQGLTLETLISYERQDRGGWAFHPGTPDYLLPEGWR